MSITVPGSHMAYKRAPFDKLRVTICHAEPVPVMLSLSPSC
jgi:hypothetical protein